MDDVQVNAAAHLVIQGRSIRSVASQFNVTRDFLKARLECKPLKKAAQQHRQRLSEEQEFRLI